MSENILDKSLEILAESLLPLSRIDSIYQANQFFNKLGYALPAGQDFIPLPGAIISEILQLESAFVEFINADTDGKRTQALLKLAIIITKITSQIDKLTHTITGLPANFVANSRFDQFPQRLLDFLVCEYIETHFPRTYAMLLLFGVLDESLQNEDAAFFQPEFLLKKVCWDRLPKYFTKAGEVAEEAYLWNSNFKSNLLLERLYKVIQSFSLPGGIYEQQPATKAFLNNTDEESQEIRIPIFQAGDTPETYGQFGALISAAGQMAGKKKGLAMTPYIFGGTSFPFNLHEDYDITLEVSGGIDNGIAIVLRPPLDLEFLNNFFTSPASIGEFNIKISLKKKVNKQKEIFVFGSETTSHLSIKNVEFKVFFTKKQDKIDYGIEFEIKEGKVILGVEGADGFIEKILSGIHMEMDFALGAGATAKGGIYFKGSGGLEIQIPLHLTLSPLKIENIVLKLNPVNGTFPLITTTTLGLDIGPIKAIVEGIGVKLLLSFPKEGGNLGRGNFDLGFQPPNGLGLSINAGAVIGGGYLFFDFEKEEYAGVLELTIAGFISAKAIGLITTKMPDGSKGFSMLIIITAEFNPPFQLGYGFTLIGVGGLLGLNRTVLLDPLRDGVRTGAVNNIMFPTNVIANAPRIISDLKTIFPPYEGKFLIGPMGKIGWGTPTLISLSFGLIIEIPGNLAILGVLKVILPDEKVPIVKIQVAFVGTIDFDKKMLTFDASLYESNILQTMTLEGDMAVRLAWGDKPNFIMTVGGFHPSFTPPPLALPTLRRLAINILNTDIARIRVECYQAVTSNTVQFGARAEIFFDLKACSIDGHIGFDAIFQFNPFYFIIELSAGFNLKAIGINVMTVRVRMSLEGPTPWHAKGTGKVSLLLFDIEADFDKTWGESKTTTLPNISILPQFIETIKKKEQWSTVLSTGKNLTVSLRKLDEATESLLVLHPAGSLVLQQKLLPLKVNIDKIGNQKTADVRQLKIESASSGTIPLAIKEIQENFARAQYQNLSNAEKLSKPSFEKMQGGVEISMGGTAINNGKMVRRKIEYELTIIDKEPVKPLPFGKFFLELGIMFNHFIKGNSVSKSKLSKNTLEKLQPFDQKLDVNQELFAVAFQKNNKAFNSSATFGSEIEAQTFMQDQIKANPNLKREIHIVPQFELEPS